MHVLRDYQQQAVRAVVQYFRAMQEPAVLVLPTGAGKSLVIAELARLAKGRVLVLTHVKELVAQNHAKYQGYGLNAGVYAAGLGLKQHQDQVIFASIQSVARNLTDFSREFSLVVVDECHRVALTENSTYQQTFRHLTQQNPKLKILGLTATPYRLGQGYIYQFHYQGAVHGDEQCFFRWCIYELSIKVLLDRGYLTKPTRLDCAVLSYDFSQLRPASNGNYSPSELDVVINHHKRVTPQIINQVIRYADNRQGVMIFASTSKHAHEILSYLPASESALILSGTPSSERASIIEAFKQRKLKYLVNVSVLTTGFDAPHVDLIAILRPTESAGLYQQMVGRGLRLCANKQDCLVLDYAGNLYALDKADIGPPPPDPAASLVTVPCPVCRYPNQFWGKQNSDGFVLEHYGRRCQGMLAQQNGQPVACGYRFKAKFCPNCGTEHDIAARHCQNCQTQLVDPDKKLQEALKLKDCLILYPSKLECILEQDQQQRDRLRLIYLDNEGQQLTEWVNLATVKAIKHFCQVQVPPMLSDRHIPFKATTVKQLAMQLHRLQPPQVVIGQKQHRFWRIRDKLYISENINISK